jgi:cellulase
MDQALQSGSKCLLRKIEKLFLNNITVVLAMSIWKDATQQMAWLDAGTNGPCVSGSGSPSNIQSQHPNTHVVFSNIRWGDIGSTTKG